MALRRGGTRVERAARRAAMRRTRRQLALDRRTAMLGVAAVATVAGVAATEVTRLITRRAQAAPADEGILGSAQAVTQAVTQDAVTVAVEGYSETSAREAALLHMFAGFAGAFAYARVSTYGMRRGWWPLGNVHLGGRHIHHFVPGILFAFASGAAALVTSDERLEPALAWPFGIGLGLTLDEAALLLELQDVYWSREGILSVQLSLAMMAALGAVILSTRLIRRGERQALEAGLIPEAP